jgi:hypothetical protein
MGEKMREERKTLCDLKKKKLRRKENPRNTEGMK